MDSIASLIADPTAWIALVGAGCSSGSGEQSSAGTTTKEQQRGVTYAACM